MGNLAVPSQFCASRVSGKEDLEAAAAEGRGALFSDRAGRCGVVAVREEALYGMRALYIFEIFLAQRWHGKGAAKAMDTALVSKAANRYPLVWEHIHSENLPSLRVALAQGRSVVETEYFFPDADDCETKPVFLFVMARLDRAIHFQAAALASFLTCARISISAAGVMPSIRQAWANVEGPIPLQLLAHLGRKASDGRGFQRGGIAMASSFR